jgi:hypothetical protein
LLKAKGQELIAHATTAGDQKPMVEELEQEYAALRDKVNDLQEYL